MNRIFITGEDGMLAREIERQLLTSSDLYRITNGLNFGEWNKTFRGSRAWNNEFDVRNYQLLKDVLTQSKTTIVVHTAAIAGSDKCVEDFQLTYDCNVTGTWNVAMVCRELGIKMVYFSTTAILDPNAPRPYTESSPQKPFTYYGATKQAGESIARSVLDFDQLLILRPCFVYGSPRDTSSNIAKMIHAHLRGEEVTLNIDPRYQKDYMFIEDFGSAFKILMDANAIGEYNISYGSATVYSEVVKTLEKVIRARLDVKYRPETDYMKDHIVSGLKMRSLGWQPIFPLADGMKEQFLKIKASYR